jgi:hypothetical protein
MRNRLVAMVTAMTVGVLSPVLEMRLSAQAQEAVKVHGHWTIDVKQADGTVVSHHEFENALVGSGATALLIFLARGASVNQWEVLAGPCAPYANCLMVEASSPTPPGPATARNVTVAALPEGQPTRLELQGSITVQQQTTITSVGTQINLCMPRADNCLGTSVPFTARTLPAPIPVQQGQVLQVTVRISFS